MRKIVIAAAVVGVISAPVFAEPPCTPQPSRAQVRAEVVELQKEGFNPVAQDPYFPPDVIQAQVAARQEQEQTAYGATRDGSSQSGSRNCK